MSAASCEGAGPEPMPAQLKSFIRPPSWLASAGHLRPKQAQQVWAIETVPYATI